MPHGLISPMDLNKINFETCSLISTVNYLLHAGSLYLLKRHIIGSFCESFQNKYGASSACGKYK